MKTDVQQLGVSVQVRYVLAHGRPVVETNPVLDGHERIKRGRVQKTLVELRQRPWD